MKVRVTVELVHDEKVSPGDAHAYVVKGRTTERICVCDSWLSTHAPRLQFDVEMRNHRSGLLVGIGDTYGQQVF